MAGFTAIATGIGLAATAGTTIGSFAQAGEQAKLKREAEEAAAKSMMDARKKLEVNYYEQLGIQKEPYELARRELLSQGALATQALMEGDERSLAAGVGRVQLAQQAGQERVATAMQQEKAQLDKLVAGEDTRLRDIGVQLDTMEAQGAQQAAADAQRAEAMAIQQGFAGLTSLGSQLVSLAPLYEKTPEVRAAARIDKELSKQGDSLKNVLSNVDVSTLNLSSDAKAILVDPATGRVRNPEELNDNEFNAFIGSLSLPTLQGLRKFSGLNVSTRGRNPDPSDIGMRQLSSTQISPVDMSNYNIQTVEPNLMAQPYQEAFNVGLNPVDLTNYQLPNLSTLPQQIPLIPGTPNIMPSYDPFNLFNINRR